MFSFHKVAWVQYLGEVDIFHMFVKISSSLQQYKNYKNRDFPKLWSWMYCHFLCGSQCTTRVCIFLSVNKDLDIHLILSITLDVITQKCFTDKLDTVSVISSICASFVFQVKRSKVIISRQCLLEKA